MNSNNIRPATFFVALVSLLSVVALQGLFVTAAAQKKRPPQADAKTPAKRYQLKITEDYVIGVSLKAKNAKLSDIAAEIAKRLGAKVILGPSIQKDSLTVEFSELTLEPAMQLLAPHVYIDYEIRAQAQPKPLGIFLFGDADPMPATNAVVTGSSQAMMIEGNTEDDTTAASDNEETDLEVDFEKSRLSVKSKHQLLVAVVLDVADAIGIPAEIRGDSTEMVNTEMKDVAVEDAVTRLSPNVRFYIRVDLKAAQRTPLRLVLITPPVEKTASQ